MRLSDLIRIVTAFCRMGLVVVGGVCRRCCPVMFLVLIAIVVVLLLASSRTAAAITDRMSACGRTRSLMKPCRQR